MTAFALANASITLLSYYFFLWWEQERFSLLATLKFIIQYCWLSIITMPCILFSRISSSMSWKSVPSNNISPVSPPSVRWFPLTRQEERGWGCLQWDRLHTGVWTVNCDYSRTHMHCYLCNKKKETTAVEMLGGGDRWGFFGTALWRFQFYY